MTETFGGDGGERSEGYIDHEAEEQARKIRELNDSLRKFVLPWALQRLQPPNGDKIVATVGVQALAADTKLKAICAIEAFDAFNEDCDPYNEHQMGIVQADGHDVMFWHDYYDRDFEYGSPDPADPEVTRRVMTILRPEER